MATKQVHSDVLDKGPNEIRANCNLMALISSYTPGDNYATVFGRILASVSVTATDFVFGSSGANRTLTGPAGKSATATAAATGTPDLAIAYLDTATSRVLWVTDETSNVAVPLGYVVSFPTNVYQANQPI